MILPMIPRSLTIFRGSILGLPYPFVCPRYESEISQVRMWRESQSEGLASFLILLKEYGPHA